MGAACCVAAGDKTIVSGSGSNRKALHRNIRYSPTRSLRPDNRGQVVGEDTSISWFSDAICRIDGSEIKYESALEDGNPTQSFESRMWLKSATSEGTAGKARTPGSDQSISRNASIDVNLEQHYVHPTSSATRCPLRSPRHHRFHQLPDNQILGLKSPNRYLVGEERLRMTSCSNESTADTYSELMATSHFERESFDSDTWGFHHENIRKSSGRISASLSVDLQICGVCSKLLSEKSLWSSQKIIISDELSVVAVLTCGHVYHAECLEYKTPEIDKYDPPCPICTLGEKHKSSEQVFRAETDFKAKINRRSRNRIVDSDMGSESAVFSRQKSSGKEKRASSSSMKNSIGRPFLRKHFSFGQKGINSPSENHCSRKKGLFQVKSSKM
ncbi:hypothetical protein like AT4G39140 [Hibiscus trionum]|uniref:RING-type domain-containing protein n=1 Tax=Hibiscus trionum TaxID=183268 RepID=A0A9W7H985_HIBTR|nr:hypothetical protein like AT4G39140 [Hibiscus trionum]